MPDYCVGRRGLLRPIQRKADRIISIVGHTKGVNLNISEVKLLSGFENFPIRSSGKFWLNCLNGIFIRIDWYVGELRQSFNTDAVIVVFVS